MKDQQVITSKDIQAFSGNVAGFFGGILFFIVKSIKKYPIAFLGAAIVCAAILYWNGRNQSSYYESEMACIYSNFHKKTFGEMIEKLDKLAASHSSKSLAIVLNMPENAAAKIISIKGKNIAGSPLDQDLTPDQVPFYIQARTTDNSIFPFLEAGIIHYLNTGSPAKVRRNEMEAGSINKRLSFIQKDIHETDSIIGAYANFLRHTRAVSDSAAGFSNINEILKYKGTLEEKEIAQDWRKSEMANTVEVLHSFLPPDNPVRRSQRWLSIFLISIGCGLVVAVIWNLFSKVSLNEDEARTTSI